MKKRYVEALCSDQSHSYTLQAQVEFLNLLWPSHARTTTFLATSNKDGHNWKEHPIDGCEIDQVENVLSKYPAEKFNIYFCPNTFAKRVRKTRNALPTRCAWVDIDDASPEGYKPKPSILWETSPNRYQGIWNWKKEYPPEQAEQYSRNLWVEYGGDCGWSITKMLRLPGTINHKDCYDRPRVRLIDLNLKPHKLPKRISNIYNHPGNSGVLCINPTKHNARRVIKKFRRSVGLEVGLLMTDKRVRRLDRSKRVFQIIVRLVEVGATDDEIGSVLSVNAYFVDKWGTGVVAMEQQIAKVRAKIGADQ
jgi:hypothetical protein